MIMIDTVLQRVTAYLKEHHKRAYTLGRMLKRRQRARTTAYPDWASIIAADARRWATARARKCGPKVLVATSIGAYLPATTVESLLAAALTLRGAEVHVLLCDAALPACFDANNSWYPEIRRFAKRGPADLCATCYAPARAMFDAMGLTVHTYSSLLTAEERDTAHRIAAALPLAELKGYQLDGIAVGEHALAGALRFFARASLEGERYGERVARRFLAAALLSTFATRRLLTREGFSSAVFHHGIYVPQGITGEVARRAGVRVVNWNPAYRKKCFIFSHGDTYHHTLMAEPVAEWEHLNLTPAMEAELLDYLKSRWQGTKDWIWFHERPMFDVAEIAAEVGVDFSKTCVGLLTNVAWDAQLHYPANAFPDMLDWIVRTIEYFARRPELQLLIRIHPAETRGELPSRQPAAEEIRKAFPVLPKNVFVIGPESLVSTYVTMNQCDAVLIYGTKTGVELTSTGIPVIVAGEAWVRGKGFTLDANTKQEYFRLLDRLPLKRRLDPATMQRARKYAYHFFFRRMIPIDAIEPAPGFPPYRLGLKRLADAEPGRSLGLDVICDGILEEKGFIFPAGALE
jgi:hypothetical protein